MPVVTISIKSVHLGAIIGAEGRVVRKLQDETGARISVSRDRLFIIIVGPIIL